jgi:hypothetical protein
MMMDNTPPTEEELADLLSQIQPRPGPRFHQKMAEQPWNRRGLRSYWAGFTPLRAASTLGLLLLLVIGISLISPSWDTLAQRVSQFFYPAAEEQIRLEIEPNDLKDPLARFDLSIAQAEELAGFDLKIPTGIPSELKLTGADYNEIRSATILNYITADGRLVLRITQQRLGPDYQEIGPSAQVEKIQIGTFSGEYVSGGWMIPVTEVESGVDSPPGPATPQATWNANVELQTLRWSDAEFLYEIILAGDAGQPGYLDKEGLIALANRMQ